MAEDVLEMKAEKMDQDSPGKNVIGSPDRVVDST